MAVMNLSIIQTKEDLFHYSPYVIRICFTLFLIQKNLLYFFLLICKNLFYPFPEFMVICFALCLNP